MTRTDKPSSTNRAKKFVKHLWKGKADKQTKVALSPVNSGLTLPATAPTQPTQLEPKQPASPSPSQKTPRGLWEKAYQLVEQEDSELLACYEKYILSTAGQSPVLSAEEREAELRTFASQKLKAVQEGDLKVIIHGKEVVVKEQIDRVIRCILAVKDVVREVLDTEPHAAIAWAGVVVILPFLVNPLTQADDATQLISYISDLLVRMRVIEDTRSLSASDGISSEIVDRLGNKIVTLYAQVIRSQMRIACQYSRSSFLRFWRDVVQADDWQQSLADLKDGKEGIDEDLRVMGDNTLRQIDVKVSELHEKADKTIRMLNDISQDLTIAKLPVAKFAGFNAFDPSLRVQSTTCLANTRTEILKDIEEWGLESDDNCIFWLSGMAGTGKSTISRTIAERFHKRKLLGASFFFSRTGELRNQATALFSTLASQLTDTIPELRPYVKDVIDQDRSIGEQPPQSQWQRLVLEPLSQLDKSLLLPLNVVIVIDALDECRDHDRHNIMGLFAQTKGLNMIHVRTMIVSRPERFIVQGFQKLQAPSQTFTLRECKLDSDEQDLHTMRDVTIFLNSQLSALAIKHELDPEWPGEDVKQTLVKRTGRLFIYAATVCRFLDGVFPEDKLEALLSTNPEDESPMADLDEIYHLVLRQNITESTDKKTLVNLFQRIVGSIVLLNENLSQQSLAMLLDIPLKRVHILLSMLRSVLVVPEDKDNTSPISLFHLSFHDFLLDVARCSDLDFHVDEKVSHERIFDSCLNTMDHHLTKDICKLHHPGSLHKEVESSLITLHVPCALQYSCLFWVRHLGNSNTHIIKDGRVHSFLNIHFLHWLEALSLIQRLFDGIGSIILLEDITNLAQDSSLNRFVHDAKLFAFHVRSAAEEAPLQIYCAGLVLTPQKSLVRQTFQHEIPPWFEELPAVEETWDPAEEVLDPQSCLECIAVSESGKIIASSSGCHETKGIFLWETATGKQILKIPVDCPVLALKFLENDTKIAAVYERGDIMLFDTTTGEEECIFGYSAYYYERLTCAAFSNNKFAVVQLLNRNTIYFLSLSTRETFEWGPGLHSPTISPNGSFLAAKSPSGVHVWDVAKKWIEIIPQETLTSGNSLLNFQPNNPMIFSSDSTMIAFGLESGYIVIWNLLNKGIERELKGGHSSPVRLIAFSLSGTRLVSSDIDDGIKVWDIRSGESIRIFQDTSCGPPRSLEFISNDLKILACFINGSTKVWNLDLEQSSARQPRKINAISVAQDASVAGILFGDGYDNSILELWNLQTGEKFQFESTSISVISLSLDGRALAVGHESGMVTLWETVSRRVICRYEAHEYPIDAVTFSHDGGKLASTNFGSRESPYRAGEVKVWDVQELSNKFNTLSPSRVQSETSISDPISWPGPDNLSTSKFHAFKPEKELSDIPNFGIQGIALSHDANTFAAIYTGEVRIWNLSTGSYQVEFEQPYDGPCCIEFLPDRPVLAVGYDSGVKLYDSMTGHLIQQLEYYHWSSIKSLTSQTLDGGSASAIFHFEHVEARMDHNAQKTWLCRNGERILYLPSSFRFDTSRFMKSGVCCIQGDHVFLGTVSHEVLRLHFQPDFAPALRNEIR